MAEGYFALDILDQMEEDIQARRYLRDTRRRLRDSQDPFQVPEKGFVELFRVLRQLAMDLIVELTPDMRRIRSSGLSVTAQVLCVLRLFASGSYQRDRGQDFLTAMSQTSVSRCVRAVTRTMENRYFREVIKFPETPEEREAACLKSQRAAQPFPGVIGAIDCTHVPILTPSVNEEAYLNRYGFHSINVQLICDPDLRILNVNARFGGSRYDSAIWGQSPVRLMLELYHRRGDEGMWLLGDNGYAIEPWLMTPILDAPDGTPEAAYTSAHSRARSTIERCNALLKLVWRLLSGVEVAVATLYRIYMLFAQKERILRYKPALACRIINTCAILHNLRSTYRVVGDVEEIPVVPQINDDLPPLDEALNEAGRRDEGKRVRNRILLDHFV